MRARRTEWIVSLTYVPGRQRVNQHHILTPTLSLRQVVTATDQAVEVFVRAQIAQAYPGYGFIGEESDAGGEVSVFSDKGTFVVDPIDGTTNFVHGFPECCISLGFCLGRTPTVG